MSVIAHADRAKLLRDYCTGLSQRARGDSIEVFVSATLGLPEYCRRRSPRLLGVTSMQPETRYARSGDVHIAYQVFGEGPLNVIFAPPPSYSNVEHWWESPDATGWLLRLASYARVVMFDKRGTGMSDRVADLAGLDQRMDDLRAVMEAADMEEAALLGMSEGGPMALLFACNPSAAVPCAGALRLLCPLYNILGPHRGAVSQLRRACLGYRRQLAVLCTNARERSDFSTLVGAVRATWGEPSCC